MVVCEVDGVALEVDVDFAGFVVGEAGEGLGGYVGDVGGDEGVSAESFEACFVIDMEETGNVSCVETT